jgi:purine-nucleoside phosphorylase
LHQIPVHRGCYLAISGPAFETPAEIRAFAKLGADAVGMSTVPEAMIANALGMKVIGLSCISNLAAGISDQALSHQDVEDASIQALPNMKKIILEFTTKIAGDIF